MRSFGQKMGESKNDWFFLYETIEGLRSGSELDQKGLWINVQGIIALQLQRSIYYKLIIIIEGGHKYEGFVSHECFHWIENKTYMKGFSQ